MFHFQSHASFKHIFICHKIIHRSITLRYMYYSLTALVSGSTNTGTIKPTTTTTTTTTETSITSIKPTISITGVSVTATTKPTFTVRISSTISSTPTTTNSSSPTSPSSAIIGSVVGVLIVVLVGIIMVILVVAFVWKRKERSGKLTINNDTATGPGGVTNPMCKLAHIKMKNVI